MVSQQALPQRSPGPKTIPFKGWPGWVQVLQDHRCKAGLTGLLKWALNVDTPPRQEHALGWDPPPPPAGISCEILLSAGGQGMRRRAMQDTSEVLQEAKKDLGFFQYEKYFLKSKTFLPLP